MSTVTDTLFNWARKTSTSFGDMRFLPSLREEDPADDGLVYQLRHWPDLYGMNRIASVLRALSVMSHRPVNRRWLIATTRLAAEQVDQLLQRLVDEDALLITDTSQFTAAARVPFARPSAGRAAQPAYA